MLSIAKYILPRNILFSFKSFNNRNVVNVAKCISSKYSYRTKSVDIKSGPGLKDFLNSSNITNDSTIEATAIPYLNKNVWNGNGRKVFFEVYGCQMNVSDTEIVWSILKQNGFKKVADITNSDVILVVTCAIREGAEDKIWNRLKHLVALKKNRSPKLGRLQIGILGCMAERLKNQLLEKEQYVDLVAGPDSYKDLPRLLSITENGQSAINVLLSLDETYADIVPVRLNEDRVTAFVSIMRGCDNMCSYCIVPFTRGRERSRPFDSIINEVKLLYKAGIKEITLLGQNVNSYRDLKSDSNKQETCATVNGFKTVYKTKIGGLRFSELLRRVAENVPEVRIRFTSPHPKDFQDSVLEVINEYPNICKNLHLPAQSGNSAVLERMRRGYTRESYLDLVQHIKHLIPSVTLSSDFICGFCGETDEEFADTLSLMEQVKYNVAYLFAYSMREKTTAHRRYLDDISDEVKIIRLKQMVTVFRKNAAVLNAKRVGSTELILIENTSKRTNTEMFGRNDGNIKVIVPSIEIPIFDANLKLSSINKRLMKPGDFVCIKITESNSQVLKGEPLYHTSISQYYSHR